jgi:predicted DNA-binding transcriptional regulator AlpA
MTSSPGCDSFVSFVNRNDMEPIMENTLHFLKTPEAAALCQLSTSHLNKLRGTGGGPLFLKLGSCVRYRLSDLVDWSNARVRKSTSVAPVPRER